MNLEENISALALELESGKYRPGRSVCFVVTQPSPREIFAADFRDRIVHHLFVGELLDMAERMFVFDSFACRKNKGTHKAVARLQTYARKVTKNFRAGGWYMKLDLASFFMSIDHNILFGLTLDVIERHSESDKWKKEMTELARIIVFHKPNENYWRKGNPELAKLIPPHKSLLFQSYQKGLPIGNYSSQFFANLYLNKLDHHIKRDLKCPHYVRYVDDLVFLSENREELEDCRKAVKTYLKKNLNLSLNNKKTVIQPIARGIDFLGYFLKAEKVYPKREVYGRYKNKLFQAAIGKVFLPWQKSRAIAASYRGHSEYFS
jgi:retron-type reverse transcriptase